MAFLNVKNRAKSTLASGISDTDTSLTVAEGEGSKFPDSNFHITIENEILLCTSRSGDVFTVERGKEGTTPASHVAGNVVELRITAQIIDEIKSAFVRTATKVVAASDSTTEMKNSADYVCDGTADDVEIQAAIDDLPAGGGKVILSEGIFNVTAAIKIKNNVILEGIGWSTIIKHTVSDALRGSDSTNGNSNIVIRDLSMDGQDSYSTPIGIYKLTNGLIENVYVHDIGYTGAYGMYFQDGENVIVRNCKIVDTDRDGIQLKGMYYSTVQNCYIEEASYYAIDCHNSVNRVGKNIKILNNSIYNCERGINMSEPNSIAEGNYINTVGVDAFDIREGNAYNIKIIGNTIINVTGNGAGISTYYATSGSGRLTIIGNFISDIGKQGILIKENVPNSIIKGNIVKNCSKYVAGNSGIYLDSNAVGNIVSENICYDDQETKTQAYGIRLYSTDYNIVVNNYVNGNLTGGYTGTGNHCIIRNNLPVDARYEQEIKYMKNTSGGTLVAGSVVILKSVASANEITTTTTAGDKKVFGMVVDAIDNNAWGYVLVLGTTTLLKVNGTTDIAIGDFLSTYTEAGIAKKAASGEMAFAIALEAYTGDNSNGVIDALIISPRLV